MSVPGAVDPSIFDASSFLVPPPSLPPACLNTSNFLMVSPRFIFPFVVHLSSFGLCTSSRSHAMTCFCNSVASVCCVFTPPLLLPSVLQATQTASDIKAELSSIKMLLTTQQSQINQGPRTVLCSVSSASQIHSQELLLGASAFLALSTFRPLLRK
jgi:hypothetical protein